MTITIKIADKKQAKMLYEMLRSMNFVKEIDMSDEYDLSKEEIQILEERLADYKKNPKSGKSIDAVIKDISQKYVFKNHH